MDLKRLSQQIEFLVEIDRLKSIVRQTLLVDGSRQRKFGRALMASGGPGDGAGRAFQSAG